MFSFQSFFLESGNEKMCLREKVQKTLKPLLTHFVHLSLSIRKPLPGGGIENIWLIMLGHSLENITIFSTYLLIDINSFYIISSEFIEILREGYAVFRGMCAVQYRQRLLKNILWNLRRWLFSTYENQGQRIMLWASRWWP